MWHVAATSGFFSFREHGHLGPSHALICASNNAAARAHGPPVGPAPLSRWVRACKERLNGGMQALEPAGTAGSLLKPPKPKLLLTTRFGAAPQTGAVGGSASAARLCDTGSRRGRSLLASYYFQVWGGDREAVTCLVCPNPAAMAGSGNQMMPLGAGLPTNGTQHWACLAQSMAPHCSMSLPSAAEVRVTARWADLMPGVGI